MSGGANTGGKPRLLLFGASPEPDPRLAAMDALFEVHREPGFDRAAACVQRLGPDVVAVGVCTRSEAGVHALDELHRERPDLPLVALSDEKDPDLILSAMRAGAREFVVARETGELSRVFGGLARLVRDGRPGGTIVSVFPSKGGLGATTLAVNLAGALLEGNQRVVLVDLDLQMGDTLVFLDLASRYSIRDVLANQRRLDGELLSSSLTRHGSGLFVLSQPELLGDSEELSSGDIARLLGFLAQQFDYVVCDGLRRFDERSVAALDASDQVLVLLVQSVPALRNAHRTLELFRRLNYGANKVGLVVNRFQGGREIELGDVTQHLGLEVRGTISNDYRAVMAAMNKGLLLKDSAPRARITGDIRRLALSLAGIERANGDRGFLRSLFRHGGEEGARHGTEPATEAL